MAANSPPPVIVVKKVKGGHGHHGGAWKVAYADFVTAMMSLFLVLWLVSQTDQETQSQVSQYFRTGVFSGSSGLLSGSAYGVDGKTEAEDAPPPGEMGQDPILKQAEVASKQAIQKLLEQSPEARALLKNVIVQVINEGLLIEIIDGGDDMSFDLNSADLKPSLVELLKRLAPVFKGMPSQLQIHGHTDARPFPKGSTRTNWSLSFERAEEARKVLLSAGVADAKIAGIYAHGATRLLYPEKPEAPENRRLTLLALRRGADSDLKKVMEIVRQAKDAANGLKIETLDVRDEGEGPKPAASVEPEKNENPFSRKSKSEK